MKARFEGNCRYCGKLIRPGQHITRAGTSWVHEGCDDREVERDSLARSLAASNVPNEDFHDALRRFDEAEYRKGKAEVEQIQAISTAGSELREQLYREMEQAAYDRGEDY